MLAIPGNPVRAGYILESAKVDKGSLELIAKELKNTPMRMSVVLNPVQYASRINGTALSMALLNVFINYADMFRLANQISLLLESNIAILSSEIKMMEDELSELEKTVNNFSFLLADGKAYDFAYSESFSDEKNREYFDFDIPDRSSLTFSEQDQCGTYGDEGMIAINPALGLDHPISVASVRSNASAWAMSAGDINNTTLESPGNGWRVSLRSPAPILSELEDFSWIYNRNEVYPGVLYVLEYFATQPVPADTIRIDPFCEVPFELTQVIVYETLESKNGKHLLSAPRTLDRVSYIYFPTKNVAKFELLLRQFTYSRDPRIAVQPELDNQIQPPSTDPIQLTPAPVDGPDLPVYALSPDPSVGGQNFITDPPLTAPWDLLLQEFIGSDNTNSGVPVSPPSNLYGWLQKNSDVLSGKANIDASQQWTDTTFASKFLNNLLTTFAGGELSTRTYARGPDRVYLQPTSPLSTPNPILDPPPTTTSPTQPPGPTPESFAYKYVLGLKNIKLALSSQGFKGAFVTKQIEAPGDVVEVKLKAIDYNFVETSTQKDSSVLTSTEYSVTNKSKPMMESDWIPIMPIGSSEVHGERLIPNEHGVAYFRFPALDKNINLYKNGYFFNSFPISEHLIRPTNTATVLGVSLPVGQYGIGDILTCDYLPAQDYSIVDFSKTSLGRLSLAAAFDDDGAGEAFSPSNKSDYTLLREPFIDYDKVESATYNEEFGLTPYNPVVIKFDDGTLAINLTNYKSNNQTSLDPSKDGYYFIQNKTQLLFNKPPVLGFRVFYDYFPSNIRIRVVLRSNNHENVSPKVDFIQLKAKTRKSDVKRV